MLTERNLLTGRYDSASVANALLSADEWKPYPTIDNRDSWMALPEAVRDGHVGEADSLIGTTWPPMPATVLLEFVRTGNRSNYQRLSFERREKLAKLVLGEVFENEGRFLDDIVDGIWAISEETYWGVPAHLDIQSDGYGLPNVDEPTVDLFAAETGMLFAWTLYLLGDRLDSVSPLVRPRMRSELKRRILDPNLTRDDFWWMALDPSVINNWTPWVNSNWLTVVLIAEEDPARRSAGVYKIMRSVDVFINSYPDDGGCDEGPGYWSRAGGSLIEVLDLLNSGTGGLIDIYDEPLIQEMGRFIIKGHASGDYFINFADAHPRVDPPVSVVYTFGERIGDEEMKRFASAFAQSAGLGSGYVPGRFGHLGRQLMTLFQLDELLSEDGGVPLLRDVWLPDIELMTARTSAGSSEGLMLAAKAGHNEENHNHNDVGSFMLYVDGEPAIIDLGPATYTRKTFSDERYSIWNLQSGYHNVPAINGFDQPFGARYRASDVEYRMDDDSASLRMDLANAYPPESAIESWVRALTLERDDPSKPVVALSERFTLNETTGSTSLHLMTHWSVEEGGPGLLRLQSRDSSVSARSLVIEFDPQVLEASVETIDVDDAILDRNWGQTVRRIVLDLTEEGLASGSYRLSFSLEP